MQTILGANGQIGEEIARELKKNYTSEIRIVSRNPQKVNDTDTLFSADLSKAEQALKAIEGSEIAYFTLGLPISSNQWEDQFPKIVKNVIEACKFHGCKLVFFDNTYMYPHDDRILKEESNFAPVGRKGRVRQKLAEMVLQEINSGTLEAVICRAPEFYGPGKTQSITNSLIFENIKSGKKLKVPVSDRTKRSLIWTPDASRATALIGNTPSAFNQSWHLPVDNQHPTYKELIAMASKIYHRKLSYIIVPKIIFKIGALFNSKLKELLELLPRYEHNNILGDSKFRKTFPEFQVTTYEDGINQIKMEKRN